MFNFKKELSFLMVLALIASPILGSVTADGGIFGKGATIFTIDENTQYAVIHHMSGKQKMIVTVNFDWVESNKTAWIFPLPSNPESVDIDIADGAPVFSGDDLIKEAKDDLRGTLDIFLFSYISSVAMPLPFTLIYTSISGMTSMTAITGYDVHKHLEKYGLTVEVISATEGLGIYQYLTDNGLDISEGIITQLDEYVEKDFSFVVTWVSRSDITIRNPGIIMEFPTKNIFYPLILTSIYGADVIPVELMIVGHVSPTIYDEIKSHCSVKYYRGEISRDYYYGVSSEVGNFTEEIKDNWDGTFTRIKINAPSNLFKKDLWIKNKAPEKVGYATTIHDIFGENARLGTLLIFLVIFSLLIALFLGIVIFGRKKEDIPFYLIMGLGNLIGILGLIIFTIIITKVVKKDKKFPSNKIALFIISFIIAFLFSIWLLFTIIMLPLS